MLSEKENYSYYLFFICLISDYLDGFFAKKLNATTSFGKQFDSLADLISFGAFPSVIAYLWLDQFTTLNFLKYTSVLILLFSAYRLAKFNSDDTQKYDFKGLPTPANATLFFSLYFSNYYPFDFLNQYSMILIIFFSSFLMISDLNFFSLKFSNYSLKDNIEKYLIIFISLLILILIGVQSLYIIVLVYILISLVTSLFKIFSKHNI